MTMLEASLLADMIVELPNTARLLDLAPSNLHKLARRLGLK